MKGNEERKVSIVVIDSGIETTVSDLCNYVIKSTGYSVNSEGFISELTDIKPNGIHGTSVALIIRDICRNVELSSINILNERLSTDSRIMIYAMNEALKLEPDIIHMSLGTTKWKYRSYIKRIIEMAIKKNIIVVAACNNFGYRSYPACIKGVVGVKFEKSSHYSKYHFNKKKGYYYAPFSMLDIEGENELLNSCRMKGTSVAAAYITGHIANIMSKEGLSSISDIIKCLNNKII